MLRGWAGTKSRSFTLLLGLLAAAFVLSIIVYPDQAFQSSLQGLKLWWEIVFPALLPFMVLTEIFTGFGAVHALGTLLEPLMRRAFRLPGTGGWALAAGMTGGYPLGAGITAKLIRRQDLSLEEGERLLGISHLASPMLIVGVIGAGFLHRPEAGFTIALIHYAAAFLTAVWIGFSAKKAPYPASIAKERSGGLLARANRSMLAARQEDGRTFGKLMGDSVLSSVQNLLLIGGFILIFSVAVRMIGLQAQFLGAPDWMDHLWPGLLEPHLASFGLASESSLPRALQAAWIGAALAWSGLSLHAQVWSLVFGTPVRYKPFLLFRLLHAGFAFVLTVLLWNPLYHLFEQAHPVFLSSASPASLLPETWVPWTTGELVHLWGQMCLMLGFLLFCMLLFSFFIRMLEKGFIRRSR